MWARFVGQPGHQLGQPFVGLRRLGVAQLQQALQLAADQVVGELALLPARLGQPDLVEGGLGVDVAGAGVGERGRAVADQDHAVAGAQADAAGVARAHPHVEELRELVDQLGLGALGPGRILADHRRPGDLDVERVDVLEQAVDGVDGGDDAAVGVLADRLDAGVHARRLVEQLLGLEDRILPAGSGGRVLGRGGQGGEHLVDLAEQADVAAGVAEQVLDPVHQLRAHAVARRVAGGVQAGGLQETVGGQPDAPDLHAGAGAGGDQRVLLDDLADVARRVDVRDVVRNHAQLRLGGHQPGRRRVHDGGQRHARTPVGRVFAPLGGFCPPNGERSKALALKYMDFL